MREAAQWRRLQGISMEGDDALLAEMDIKEEKRRDEWMTTLPPERKPGVATQQSTKSFNRTSKEGRGDTSAWTDTPSDRAQKAKMNKSEIKMTKKRNEIIKRKRNAMHKFLRNDIADLLRTGLESNAYGRVEQLCVDQKLSSCYEFVDQSCLLILSNLSTMNKQRECLDECKEAISTLMFAAARFADLPELRELRSLFVERYGNYLEPYVNQEFIKNLKADPPTMEIKLEMMHEIAMDCGIKWNSNTLENKLYKPSPFEKTNQYTNLKNKESLKPHHQTAPKTNIQETKVAKKDHILKHGLPYKPRSETETKKKEKHDHGRVRVSPYWSSNSSSSSETITSPDNSASEDILESTKKSTSLENASISGRKEDIVGLKHKEDNLQSDKPEERMLYGLRSMGPPYIKQELTKKSTDSVPRSVRIRKPLNPAAKSSPKFSNFDEEKKMDKLLSHYSRKPAQLGSDINAQNHAPKRSGSLSIESMVAASEERKRELVRAATYHPDSGSSSEGNVHPKLPDYDDFVARLASFRAGS